MNKQKDLEGKEADDPNTIIVTAPVTIEKGKHEGIITNLIRNLPNEDEGRPYDYLDIVIKITDHEKKPELRCGFPTNISELSALGRLLIKSGMDFVEDDKIKISDIKEQLVDKKINFLTTHDTTDAGEFAKILRETIEFN